MRPAGVRVCVLPGPHRHRHSPSAALAAFYNTTASTASAIYDALWQPDGLATSLCFNSSHLAGTEEIYSWDTGAAVPADRPWVVPVAC